MPSDHFRLLYPDGIEPSGRNAFPDHEFIRTLQIDQMVSIGRESYRGIPDLQPERFFSCDPVVLRYRAEIIEEIAASEPLQQLIADALPMIRDVYEMRKVLNHGDGSLESGLSSTRYIEQYIELVELFRQRLEPLTPQSAGLRRLKDEILARSESEDFKALRRHLEDLDTRIGRIKSITLGLNLDGNLHVTDVGLVSINTAPFRPSSLMDRLLGRSGRDPMVCMSGFASIAKSSRDDERQALDSAVHRALDVVFAKVIRSWEPVINQYYHDETRFFVELMDDLRFLSAAVHFLLELRAHGCRFCRPVIRPVQDRALHLHNVYNPMLALKVSGEPIVANDFDYDENGRFYLVTGPNHGGKSIFCYSIGMAQALFQLGLPVPAERAEMSPVTGIYTHFHSAFCNENSVFAQAETFKGVLNALIKAGVDPGMAHCCNSAAFLRWPELHMGGVRLGSALLGRVLVKADLRRVGRCEATVDEIRWLPTGHSTGYGAAWKAKRPTRIAVLPVGWYHGFAVSYGDDIFRIRDCIRAMLRALKNMLRRKKLYVRINGSLCPVLGHVGMLHTVCDITKANCSVGDTAILDINPLQVRGMEIRYQ